MSAGLPQYNVSVGLPQYNISAVGLPQYNVYVGLPQYNVSAGLQCVSWVTPVQNICRVTPLH